MYYNIKTRNIASCFSCWTITLFCFVYRYPCCYARIWEMQPGKNQSKCNCGTWWEWLQWDWIKCIYKSFYLCTAILWAQRPGWLQVEFYLRLVKIGFKVYIHSMKIFLLLVVRLVSFSAGLFMPVKCIYFPLFVCDFVQSYLICFMMEVVTHCRKKIVLHLRSNLKLEEKFILILLHYFCAVLACSTHHHPTVIWYFKMQPSSCKWLIQHIAAMEATWERISCELAEW